MIRKKLTKRNMIEEASVKTRFTKYPWGQCSLNKMCVVNTRCLVPGGVLLIMANTGMGRLRPKGAPFSVFRYMNG